MENTNKPECLNDKSELKAFIDEADAQIKEFDFRVNKIKTCLNEAEELVG
ncbi:MAG: hypothetical protein ACOCV1_00230 [Bacillota bacterium]